MYYKITIEANSKDGIVNAIQECLERVEEEQFSSTRPTFALKREKMKSHKRKYYYVDWNNYMGTGSVKEIMLSKDEYNQIIGGARNVIKNVPAGVWPYKTRFEAECALDRKYQD